jgi:catechol 2,3-dioxygenase-like lactoylglutathione lyase family enzyme
MKIKYNSLIPELSVINIEESLRFYKTLGFKVLYKRDKFYFLELEQNQIMIEEVNNNWNTAPLEYPFGRGINISMTVKNIEKYYEYIKKNNIKIFIELKKIPYKVGDTIYYDTEFLIQDPNGYLLRFNN